MFADTQEAKLIPGSVNRIQRFHMSLTVWCIPASRDKSPARGLSQKKAGLASGMTSTNIMRPCQPASAADLLIQFIAL